MPEVDHAQVAAYVLGRLTADEAVAFAVHLDGCERCRTEEVELRAVAVLLEATTPSELPAGLEARTLAAVASSDATEATAPARVLPTDELADRRMRRRSRAIAATGAVAAGLAAAFVIGAGTAGRTTTVAEVRTVVGERLPGEEEKRAILRGRGFSAAARVNVVGAGRLVEVKSDTVPVIPKGTYYELWFVGPGDTRRDPNRISAGTWHPDSQGVTDVRFLIAADPALLPDIEVTEEPPDGDPAPSRRVVLSSNRSTR